MRVVVVSSHPMVQAFFDDVGRQSPGFVLVTALPLNAAAVADASDVLTAPTVAVVDASVDPTEALGVCKELRVHRPTLPISALFCCAHSAAATQLRAFVAAGVGSFLDSQLSAEQTLHVLRSVARGQGVVHLQLTERSSTALFETLSGEGGANQLSDSDLGLLKLVALGLTDHEIGRQLYLSPHTVKHRIERLRRRVHARNRVQLAAWAGRQEAVRDERDAAATNGARP